jgi:long-subunit fatty acid transport protein
MGLALAGIGFVVAGEAWGSGFQVRENSASALGNAFAGAAASPEDPSIIANNPAGMIDLSGNQASGDITIVIPSVVFSGFGLTAARQPISGGNGGDAGSAQPVPAAYGFYDASPDLKFGLALTLPSASRRNTTAAGSGDTRRSNPTSRRSTSTRTSLIGSPIGFRLEADRQSNRRTPSLPTPSTQPPWRGLPIRCCRQD